MASTKIIQDNAGAFWRVRDANDAALSHAYIGRKVRKTNGAFIETKCAAGRRDILVRKAFTIIIREETARQGA